jgi:glucan phosphoethanolaminetransferase (alkaline phosphatase superfamily)
MSLGILSDKNLLQRVSASNGHHTKQASLITLSACLASCLAALPAACLAGCLPCRLPALPAACFVLCLLLAFTLQWIFEVATNKTTKTKQFKQYVPSISLFLT